MRQQHHIPGKTSRRDGGVMMEYVILAVLIAAAVVVAVVVFSRSIATMFFTAGQGVTLQETTAKQDLDMRRKDRTDDVKVSEDYHDAMHQSQ
ncbi:MAG: hypothetical protein WCO42_00560 [bacterium]